MLHAQINFHSPLFHCRPTICGSQITLWINWKQMTLDECLWDPKTTVTQIPLSLEIEWHWNSIVSQNPLSLEFDWQPKSTVTGIPLPAKNDCCLISITSTSCTNILIPLLSHQFAHTFGPQPNLKLHFKSSLHAKFIYILPVFEDLKHTILEMNKLKGSFYFRNRGYMEAKLQWNVLWIMCHAQLRMGSHSIVQGIWNSSHLTIKPVEECMAT